MYQKSLVIAITKLHVSKEFQSAIATYKYVLYNSLAGEYLQYLIKSLIFFGSVLIVSFLVQIYCDIILLGLIKRIYT